MQSHNIREIQKYWSYMIKETPRYVPQKNLVKSIRKYGLETSLTMIREMGKYQDQLKMSFGKRMAQ